MVWTKNYKLYTNSSDKEKPNIGTKKLLHDFVEIFNGDHTKNRSLKNCASVENFTCNFCTGLGGGGSSNKTMREGDVEASNPGICYTPFVTHVGF